MVFVIVVAVSQFKGSGNAQSFCGNLNREANRESCISSFAVGPLSFSVLAIIWFWWFHHKLIYRTTNFFYSRFLSSFYTFVGAAQHRGSILCFPAGSLRFESRLPLWTILRSNPSTVVLSSGFHKCSLRWRQELSTTKSFQTYAGQQSGQGCNVCQVSVNEK